MNNKRIGASIVSIATGASLLMGLAVLPANAATLGIGASASTTVGAGAQARQAAQLPNIISRSNTAISARITALNNLNARIQSMKNVSAANKTTLSNEIQTNLSGLTALQAKIDADTDVTTALAEAKTITVDYRIYALVIPQGYIEASSDRVDTITGMLTAISAKLQTRITADQSAGKNVTAMQASLTDLNAKVADATTQAGVAESGVATLSPDQGNTTVAASNKAALVSSRSDIKTAASDLKAADADAKSIVQSLKALGGNTSASASVSASTTTN